jgi:uncharacterized protein (TIGR03435 family)
MIRPAALSFIACVMWAQTAPRFDVASIKPNNSGTASESEIRTSKGRLIAVNVTLQRCIAGAYETPPNKIFGGPDWLDVDRFDIVALADQPVSDDHNMMVMLQAVLADRFKLATHPETRMTGGYVLEAAKNGPKLEKGDGGVASADNGRGHLIVANTTMDRFAEVLSRQMHMPVLNRTDVEGSFHVRLRWSLNASLGDGPSLYTAIQEQLGLSLRPQKVPVEVIVVDHAEKPIGDD